MPGRSSDTGSGFEAELDRYIEEVVAEWEVVGAAIAVVRHGDVIYSRGFGAREVGRRPRIDGDTLFQVGSTTKAFTAAAIGILVDERKVSWDDPVIEHLPWFRLRERRRADRLTIRDLLAHRTGIIGRPYFAMRPMDADEAIDQLRWAAYEGRQGRSYCYSNLMYAVAGKLVEAASGVSWSGFVEERLLRPLGMRRSRTSPYDVWPPRHVAPTFLGSAADVRSPAPAASLANVAMPHTAWEGAWVRLPWRSYDNAAPAGSIISSAGDMARWLALHLGEGRFERRRLVSRCSMKEILAAQNPHVREKQLAFTDRPESYAMGWRRGDFRGYACLAHGGGMIGFPAFAALLPEKQVGVVVLCNSTRGPHERAGPHKAIAFRIFDRLLNAAPHDWSRDFLARSRRLQRAAAREEQRFLRARTDSAPSLPLNGYVGTYTEEAGGSEVIRVGKEGSRLNLAFAGAGALVASLEPWGRDAFRLRAGPGIAEVLGPELARFTIDRELRVTSVSLLGTSFQRRTPGGPRGE